MIRRADPTISLDEMPRDEARAWILADSLAMLERGRLRASSGAYMDIDLYDVQTVRDMPLREVIRAQPTCEVCAAGALFVSDMQQNTHSPSVVTQGGSLLLSVQSIREELEKFFTLRDLGLVEAAFEGSTGQPLGQLWLAAIMDEKDLSLLQRQLLLDVAEEELQVYAAWFSPGSLPADRLQAILTFFLHIPTLTLPPHPPTQYANPGETPVED